MNGMLAALPMYDWPQERAAVDRRWAALRDMLRDSGLSAPDTLSRRNGELPAVPGGIRDRDGTVIAPDPAELAPDGFDLHALWRHPGLLFAQTCRGPLETTGLDAHVTVIGEPDYSNVDGGQGASYSSAIVMRSGGSDVPPPADGAASLPVGRLRGCRLAYNGTESMSGYLALMRDLAALGEEPAIFGASTCTGSHLASARAVASGQADAAALDCLSWQLVRRHEPETASRLTVVGWTALRPGLPYVASNRLSHHHVALRAAVGAWVAGAA